MSVARHMVRLMWLMFPVLAASLLSCPFEQGVRFAVCLACYAYVWQVRW